MIQMIDNHATWCNRVVYRAACRGGAGGAIAPPTFRNKGAKICISNSLNNIALEIGSLILKLLISFLASIYNT